MCLFGSAGFPDIGANVDAATHAIDIDYTGIRAGVEIALFVKDFVIGKASFTVNRDFLAIFYDRCRIVAASFMFFGIADNQRNPVNLAGQIV